MYAKKIARLAQGDDINLAIQFVLNCGTDYAGSCHGGYHTGVYEFIQRVGYIPYDTCMNYIACSHDSTEGFCPHVDTTCKVHEKADGFTLVVDPKSMHQVCRTCDTFAGMGGACTAISKSFPNATVAEYGMIDMDDNVVTKIQTEIFVRGCVFNEFPAPSFSLAGKS
jgi:cathepsin X